MTVQRPLIVFDVNETLLDIGVLDPLFDDFFTTAGRMREWFAQLILYAQTLSLTGHYVPFGNLGAGVLRMLGQIHGVPITDAQVQELASRLANLPVHPDVPAGLHRLKDAGFTLVTLTNSPASAGPDPLDAAGLASVFDHRFTVAPVRRFKPTPATYTLVTDTMRASPSDTWLIAAHPWDTIGAQSMGWNTALVTRGINAPLALDHVPHPAVIGTVLTDVAEALVSRAGVGTERASGA